MFAKKKRIDIYGTLEFPLTIGCAAFIKEAEGTRRTSSVKHFITLPSGVTYIQTKNTHEMRSFYWEYKKRTEEMLDHSNNYAYIYYGVAVKRGK